jgi:hypothetical protein
MNWRKWLDGFVLAGKGILLATKEKRFWAGFVPSFIFFGTLLNLLSGGLSNFEMMKLMGFPANLQIIGKSFLGIFGVNVPFLDWLYIFAITLLQSILIGLIVLLWHKKRQSFSASKSGTTPVKSSAKSSTVSADATSNSANVEKAGIITGLIALGAGCPTCGTTLITPLIGAIFSSGSLAITGTISTIVTIIAVIVAILSLKRIGEEAYVIIINEKYLERKNRGNR